MKINSDGQDKKTAILIFWTVFALLAVNAFLFVHIVASAHVKADIWRHIDKIFIPLMDREKDWSLFWSNHHPAPLLHLIELINIKVAGLRLDLHGYLGLFFQILTAMLILRHIFSNKNSPPDRLDGVGFWVGLLIIFLLLGLHNTVQYTWPLVTTVQYLYFFGIVVYLSVDKCIQCGSVGWHLAVAAASSVLMIANADYGLIFLAAIVCTCILACIVDRRWVYFSVSLIMFAILLVYRLLLNVLTPSEAHYSVMASTTKIYALLAEPLQTFVAYCLGLNMGLFDIISLKNRFPGAETILIIFALAVAFLFFSVIIIFVRKKLWRVTVIPLSLMLISIVFSAGTFAFRYDPSTDTIWSLCWPRFGHTQKLAVVGMLWALWIIFREHKIAHPTKRTTGLQIFIILSISSMLLYQGLEIYDGWRAAPYHRRINENASLGIVLAGNDQENRIKLPRTIVGGNSDYHDALLFLKHNKLNVFSDHFPRGAMLENYWSNKQRFERSNNVIIKTEFEQNDKSDSKHADMATWTKMPDGVLVTTNTDQATYLRVEVRATTFTRNGVLIKTKNSWMRIDSYEGIQVLYFGLKGGQQIRITTNQGVALCGMELREYLPS